MFLAFEKNDTFEFLQKKLKELDEIIKENMSLIIEKDQKKKKKKWKKNSVKNSKNSTLKKFKIHLMVMLARIT